MAYSEASLFLAAYCTANAAAYARACSFTKADGTVDVQVANANGQKTVSLGIKLKSASTTYAIAQSAALADAYVGVEAQSFTDASAYCLSVKNMSPFCGAGTAASDLSQLAVASATSFSDAVSEAGAGGFGLAHAHVYVDGTSISTVKSHLLTIAKSWAFASAASSAQAFALAVTEIINGSFSAICAAKHAEICDISNNKGKGVCGYTPEVACASALSYGSALGVAIAGSIASSFVQACAESEFVAILKADVDCKSTPKFTWKTARGGAQVSCRY